jgi:energy-coupling factor transporter transmembrane protein EcfT
MSPAAGVTRGAGGPAAPGVPPAPGRALATGTDRGLRAAPVLLGALVGALAAGRLESALGCLAVAVAAGVWLRVGAPPRGLVTAAVSGSLVAFALNLYLNPGTPLPWGRLAGRAPTLEGARYGLLLGARVIAGLAAWWVLLRALPLEAAADAAARVLSPLGRLGVPIRGARHALGLALRFAPLLRAEARRIARVQALRAGRAARGLAERVAGAQAVAAPLMVCALERAERTALALDARHYRGRGREADASGVGWGWVAVGLALAAWGILWRG